MLEIPHLTNGVNMKYIYNNIKDQQKNHNKIRTNGTNESIHLSPILASRMFIPRVKGYDTDIVVNDSDRRTNNETISYSSPPLDLARDFPLFSIVVSKLQRSRTSSFILTEFEIYKALDIKREKIISESFCNNFNKLKNSNIKINIENENNEIIKSYSTNLVIDWDWDSEEKCFMFQMNDIFLEFFIEETHYERIYADKFKSLKNGHAKALYLYLETMKFKNQRSTNFNEDSQLKKRYGKNIKRNADKNSKLKPALEKLKEQGVIYEYFRYKSKNENYSMCKIYRNEESFVLDNAESNKEMYAEKFARLEVEENERIKEHNNSKGIIVPIPIDFQKPIDLDDPFEDEFDNPYFG